MASTYTPRQVYRDMFEFGRQYHNSENPNLPPIPKIVELHNRGFLTPNSEDFYDYERGFALHWEQVALYASGPWGKLFRSKDPLYLVDNLPWNYERSPEQLMELKRCAVMPKYFFEIDFYDGEALALSTYTMEGWLAKLLKDSGIPLPEDVAELIA